MAIRLVANGRVGGFHHPGFGDTSFAFFMSRIDPDSSARRLPRIGGSAAGFCRSGRRVLSDPELSLLVTAGFIWVDV